MFSLWLEFLISALLVIAAGTYLSRYGDLISEKSGFGEALIGGVLIALATSLPELTTSITSALVAAPNIAVGNSFGSNTFNLLILALADLLHGPGPLMLHLEFRHILSGLLGILLSCIVAFAIVIGLFTPFQAGFYHFSIISLFLFLVYLFGIRLIFSYQRKEKIEEIDSIEKKKIYPDLSLKKAFFYFFIASVVIVLAGIRLTVSGEQIAVITGIEQSFIGSIMVAAATSLPELVTTISAIKLNAYNMAVGNVFGSNIYNMLVLVIADLFYTEGYLLSSVDAMHLITAFVGLLMVIIALIGLFYRSKRSIFNIGWDSLIIGLIYIFGFYLLFTLGVPI